MTIYTDGKRRYSSLIEQADATSKGWRLCAILGLVSALVACLGIAYIGSQAKTVPFLVVMSDDYRPVGIAVPSNQNIGIKDERVIKSIMAHWIKLLRGVSSDLAYQEKLVNDLANFVERGSNAFNKIQEYVSHPELSPFVKGKNGTVDIRISNVIKITDVTYQVDWVETSRELRGGDTQESTYRGNITFGFLRVIPPQTVLVNPIGLIARDFNIEAVR